MSTPPIQYHGPKIDADVPESVRLHLQLLYQKLGNHTQAFGLLQQQISKLKPGAASSSTSQLGGATSTADVAAATQAATSAIVANYPTVSQNLGQVNNQTGVTSYATLQGDNGAFVLLSDGASVAVSLTTQAPPWWTFLANQGAGAATVTPATGTINGAATISLATDESAMVWFDGTNWWAITAAGGGASGVTSLDGITGAVTLVAGANITITDNSPSAGDITIAASGGSGLPVNNPTFTGTMTGPHYESDGSSPGIAVGAGAGTGGAASFSGTCTDTSGSVTLTIGTGSNTSDPMFTVTLAAAYSKPPRVFLFPEDAGAVTLVGKLYGAPTDDSHWAIFGYPASLPTGPSNWSYWVVG